MSVDLVSHLPPPRPVDRRVRVLNLPLLILSLATALVSGLALRKWHDLQVSRHADSLLQSAWEASEVARWKEVDARLNRYLRLRPDDLDAMELNAKAKAKTAQTRTELAKAIQSYLDLVRLDGSRQRCWLPIAELQLRAGAPGDALGAISQFLISQPQDGYALAVRAATMAQLHAQGGSLPLALVVDAYRDAVRANPQEISLASQLASLIEEEREKGGTGDERGLDVMDQLVQRSPDQSGAYFARYLFRRQLKPRVAGAPVLDPDLEKAMELEPENVELQFAFLRDRLEAIVQRNAIAEDEDAVSRLQSDLRSLIRKTPADIRGSYMLASLYAHRRKYKEAAEALEEARHAAPAPSVLLEARLAELWMKQGEWERSAAVLRRLSQIKPDSTSLRGAAELPIAAEDGNAKTQTEVLTWHAHPGLLADQLWVEWYRAETNPQMDLDQAALHLQRLVAHPFPIGRLAEFWIQLGECYFALRDWDLAAEAYQRAAANDPTNPAAWVGLAESYRQRGQIDLALDRYRHLLRIVDQPTMVGPIQVALAELQLLRLQSTPTHQRRWLDFDEAFRDASIAMPNAPALLFLDLQARLAKDPQLAIDPAKVRQWSAPIIREHEEFLGADPQFWQAAFAWHWRFGNREAALHSLVRWEAMTGRAAYPERIQMAVAGGGFAAAQAVITSARETMNPCRFSIFLAAIARDLQDHRHAMPWIEGMLLLDPDNRRLRGILAELAVYAGDVTQLQKCSSELLRLEGSDGAYSRWAKLQLLLVDARLGIPERIFWARAQARELFTHRPQWNLSMAALGNVAEMEGRLDEAISHYGDAFRSDRRDVRILSRYVSLLTLNGREREAIETLRSLPDSKRTAPEILPIAARLEIVADSPREAVRLAEVAVTQDPGRGQAWRVLGEAQLASGQPTFERDALTSFERATLVEPKDHAAWVNLLWFHVRSEHPDRTVRILETLQKFAALFRSGSDPLGPADQDYLLARCVEIEQDWPLANDIYSQSIRRRATQFRHPLPPGTVYSLELASPAELDTRALVTSLSTATRQTFGLLLSTETDEVAAQAAATFLDGDARLRTITAILRGGPEQLKFALANLAELASDTLKRGDIMLVARIHALRGDWRKAAVELRKLTSFQPTDAQLLEWAQLATSEELFEDASEALSALHEPNRWAYDVASLKVKMLMAQRQQSEAIAIALGEDLTAEQSSELLSLIGERRLALDRWAQGNAESVDHQLAGAALQARDPETFEQAVASLESVARIDPIKAALAATRILARPLGAAEGRLRLDQLVRSANTDHPENVDLYNSLAMTRESEGSVNEALRLTREALKVDPQNVAALNNLCWLLASYHGDPEAALGTIKNAMYRSGPHPALLDTLAVAELSLGHTGEAIRLLETCNQRDLAMSSPANWLHLAEAYRASGHSAQAAKIYQRLRRDRFRPTNPRDQSAFARLERSLYTEAE